MPKHLQQKSGDESNKVQRALTQRVLHCCCYLKDRARNEVDCFVAGLGRVTMGVAVRRLVPDKELDTDPSTRKPASDDPLAAARHDRLLSLGGTPAFGRTDDAVSAARAVW